MTTDESHATRTAIAAEFRFFATHRAGSYAPLYARLAAAIADAPDLLDLARLAQPGQSRPDLLLAVIHDRLLREPDPAVARYYPNLATHVAEGDPAPLTLRFVRSHNAEIADAMRHRLVQTNEIGRCAFLAPAIRLAARATPTTRQPLALIEVGASAGLNLLLDHYSYRYHTETGETLSTETGNPILHCALQGPGRPPLEPLHISWRAGIDLNPLNTDDPDDRRWLHALIWPDHPARAARLTAAIRAMTTAQPRPRIHAGEATHLLPTLAATAPAEAHLVLYHSATTAHMTPSHREQFTNTVLRLSTHRPVFWVQAEPRPDQDPRRLRLTECRNGQIDTEIPLGSYHPHGQQLRWIESAR